MKESVVKKTNTKRKISPLAVATTGAVVGAGMAVAGAMALRNKKTRDKVKKFLNKAKNEAGIYIKKVKEVTDTNKEKIEQKIVEGKKKIKKKLKKPAKKAEK